MFQHLTDLMRFLFHFFSNTRVPFEKLDAYVPVSVFYLHHVGVRVRIQSCAPSVFSVSLTTNKQGSAGEWEIIFECMCDVTGH